MFGLIESYNDPENYKCKINAANKLNINFF